MTAMLIAMPRAIDGRSTSVLHSLSFTMVGRPILHATDDVAHSVCKTASVARSLWWVRAIWVRAPGLDKDPLIQSPSPVFPPVSAHSNHYEIRWADHTSVSLN